VTMFDARKTRMIELPYGKKIMTICSAVLIQYQRVTNRQKDRTAISMSRVSVLTRDKKATFLSRVSTLMRDIDIAIILSVRPSVCPSVRNTLVLYQNG